MSKPVKCDLSGVWPHEELQRQWEAGQWVPSPSTRDAWSFGQDSAQLTWAISRAHLEEEWGQEYTWLALGECRAPGAQPAPWEPPLCHPGTTAWGQTLQPAPAWPSDHWLWWVLLSLGSRPLAGDSRSRSRGWSSLIWWERCRRSKIGNPKGPALYFPSPFPVRAALDLFPDDSCNKDPQSAQKGGDGVQGLLTVSPVSPRLEQLAQSSVLSLLQAPTDSDSTHWHIHGLAGTSIFIFFGNGTLHLPERKKNQIFSIPPHFFFHFGLYKKRWKSAMTPWASKLQL